MEPTEDAEAKWLKVITELVLIVIGLGFFVGQLSNQLHFPIIFNVCGIFAIVIVVLLINTPKLKFAYVLGLIIAFIAVVSIRLLSPAKSPPHRAHPSLMNQR